MPKINIEKLHRGYRLTDWTHRSYVLTAQDLLDIMDWCLLHARELREEAGLQETQPEQKAEEPK
jgi:hypothetical protein